MGDDVSVSRQDESWMDYANKKAKEHDSKGKYRLYAVAVKGGRVLAEGGNCYVKPGRAKHPAYDMKSIHAELKTLLQLMRDYKDEKNVTLYVGGASKHHRRINGMNNTKPCPVCQKLIKESGVIGKVVFLEDGEIRKVRVYG